MGQRLEKCLGVYHEVLLCTPLSETVFPCFDGKSGTFPAGSGVWQTSVKMHSLVPESNEGVQMSSMRYSPTLSEKQAIAWSYEGEGGSADQKYGHMPPNIWTASLWMVRQSRG